MMSKDVETRGAKLSSVPGSTLSLESLLTSIPSAFFALDAEWRFTHVNQNTQWLLGKNAEQLLGRRIWDVFPEAAGSVFEQQYEAAVREQRAIAFTTYYEPLVHWFAVRACPIPGGLAVFFDEVDGVKTSELERERGVRRMARALARESTLSATAAAIAARPTDAELHRLACESALELCDATVAWLSRSEPDGVRILAKAGSIPQLMPDAGELRPVPAGSETARALETGEMVVVADLSRQPEPGTLHRLGLRWAAWVPIALDGETWGLLCAASVDPRPGGADDVALGRLRGLVQIGLASASRGRAAPAAPAGPAEPLAGSEHWRAAFDSLSRHIAILDASGRIVAVNGAWTRFATENAAPGGPDLVATGVGADYLAICAAAVAGGVPGADAVAAGLGAVLAGTQESFDTEYACQAPDRERWFAMRVTAYHEDGARHVVVQHEDISPRRRAEALVRRQAQLLDEVDAAVICTDLEGVVTLWNDAAERLYGWPPEEALGRRMSDLASGPVDEAMIDEMITTLREHGRWEGEKVVEDRFGRSFPCAMRNSVVLDEDGQAVGIIGISVDVSERNANERNLEASRNYLRAITASIADGLLALDAEGTVIYANDAAGRLLGRAPASMVGVPVATALGRSRDEVAAMLSGDDEVRRGEHDRFVRADGHPFPASWTASSLRGGPHGEGDVLVFRDTTAEQRDREQRDLERIRRRWAGRIHDALRHKRFELLAQPIVDLRGDRVADQELLLRMRDADGSLISPADFLPAAEEHGLMSQIDRWVVDRGLRVAAGGAKVHINLSAQSIGDPALLADLRRALRHHAIPADHVTLELTETALSADPGTAADFARQVRDLGFRLALDDFGTGYNAFANLKTIPVDELKIDMQFVQDLLVVPASENVVRGVVSLAASFDVRTVAEGVEDARTLERLRELGVSFVQGYHLGRPAPLP